MPYSKLHAAAREYAERGWPVFPCRENGKEPACLNGFKDATTNLKTIDFWWKDDDFNIGFCPENAGICVVDEDTDKGGCFDASAVETVKSPHGRHFYYAGSLPASASRIAPSVDTRGRGSYVLLPPSVVDGLEYVARDPDNFPCQSYECSEVPSWVINKFNTAPEPRDRPETIKSGVVDRPEAIKLFKQYLERNPIPPEGAGSDDACYRAIARGRDLGVSDATLSDIMLVGTDFDLEWLEKKLENVETYAQNEPGCDIPLTVDEQYAKFVENMGVGTDNDTETIKSDNARLKGRPPRPPSEMPEIGFFDDDKFIPNSPDGAIGILYGKRGDHKTNTILSMLSNSSAKRVLYAAGEGSFGVERDRIPAHVSLKDRIYIVPAVPHLDSPTHIKDFIELNSEYRPEIVVIDTLATSIAGMDENIASTASLLTDNGPAGIIKRAWNCTLIFVAHSGKDASRGVRGTSGFEANVDFLIHVEADKEKGVIKTTLEKMRDGYDGKVTHWKYDLEPTTVPVPEPISQAEYAKLTATVTEKKEDEIDRFVIISYLSLNGHTDWATGVEVPELADLLTENELGPKPENGVKGDGAWKTRREQYRTKLNNANTGKKAWGAKYSDWQIADGGNEKILRWFVPPEESDGIEL